MDKTNLNDERQWHPCPEGMIQRVADRSKLSVESGNKQSSGIDRRIFFQIAAGVTALAGAAVVAYRLSGTTDSLPELTKNPTNKTAPQKSWSLGGIACVDVIKSLDDYVAQRIEDEGKVESIETHLDMCPKCKAKYDMIKNV